MSLLARFLTMRSAAEHAPVAGRMQGQRRPGYRIRERGRDQGRQIVQRAAQWACSLADPADLDRDRIAPGKPGEQPAGGGGVLVVGRRRNDRLPERVGDAPQAGQTDVVESVLGVNLAAVGTECTCRFRQGVAWVP